MPDFFGHTCYREISGSIFVLAPRAADMACSLWDQRLALPWSYTVPTTLMGRAAQDSSTRIAVAVHA